MKAGYDTTMFNELFGRLGVLMKKTRGGFWAQHTYGIRFSPPFHHGKPEAGLWFRTRGCGFDRVGGCTMCDYGSGPDSTTSEEMVGYVQQGLGELPDGLYHLLVSPLGSFLDEWEVPESARLGILSLMHETRHETFSFESRAETISTGKIDEARALLDHRPLKVYIGLESANPWISKYCINKALSLETFERAVQTLARAGASATANVVVGTPFLSTADQIEDSVRSVTWARSRGASEVCLFPIHVKQWTSLVWLYNRSLYSPPSLWSYVEVLHRLGPELCSSIELSWYSTHKYQDPNLVSSPTTCSKCYETVMHHLDDFDVSADFQCIEALSALECDCKDAWRWDLSESRSDSILDRATAAYETIGQAVFRSWWQLNRDRILDALRTQAEEFPAISGASSSGASSS